MFVKTILNKFKYFPPKLFTFDKASCTLTTATTPSVEYRLNRISDEYPELFVELKAILVKDDSYVLSAYRNDLTRFVDESAQCFRELNSDHDRFITEYLIFYFLANEHFSRYDRTVVFSDEINAIKQDVLDIFEQYRINGKLRDEVYESDVVTPIGLIDLNGYLGYQVLLEAGDISKLLIGVDNSCIYYAWEYDSVYPALFNSPYRKVGRIFGTTFMFPILGFNALLGIVPTHTYSLENLSYNPWYHTVIGLYLHSLSTLSPIRKLDILGNAIRFRDRLYELLPDNVIKKIKAKKELNQEELDSLAEFLEISSTLLFFEYKIRRKSIRYGRFKKVADVLSYCLNQRRIYSSNVPVEIFRKLGLDPLNYSDIREFFSNKGMGLTLSHNGKIYVVSATLEEYNIWAFNLSGVDLTPLRDEVLELMYNYD